MFHLNTFFEFIVSSYLWQSKLSWITYGQTTNLERDTRLRSMKTNRRYLSLNLHYKNKFHLFGLKLPAENLYSITSWAKTYIPLQRIEELDLHLKSFIKYVYPSLSRPASVSVFSRGLLNNGHDKASVPLLKNSWFYNFNYTRGMETPRW